VPPEALAILPFSSGTSGLPKGVMLTHGALVTAVRQVARGLRLTPDDVLLTVAPFSHVTGFVITLASALAAGAATVTLPRFAPETLLSLLERRRVSVLIVPPPVMPLLARHPRVDSLDLSALEMIGCGGAPLAADVQDAVAERLPRAVVGQGWGLTESTAAGAIPDRTRPTKPGSVGRIAPSTELRVLDPDDEGRGELLLRGPQNMTGYLNAPEATAETLDPDGWLHTGDLGRVDVSGNVFVLDRLKELIKVDAQQVAPAELEALLATHPAVADCTVVGRPDARRGEVPVAVVVPRGDVEAGALVDWVAERVAPYKRLHDVRFAEAVPRTPSGKILRRVLRDQPSYV
jgi:acyl-CoA synthetase (AMP-forming)/AMP-acid ligase II